MSEGQDGGTDGISSNDRAALAPKKIRYYDLVENWDKVEPHLDDPVISNILVEEFNKFTFGRWGKIFTHQHVPHDFESCDWWMDEEMFHPFWMYVKHAACHWLVNFTLALAKKVEPTRAWRIITSEKHSTVWDGAELLFDFNFQAMGIPAEKCFQMAFEDELQPGDFLETFLAEHYTEEVSRRKLVDQQSGLAVPP